MIYCFGTRATRKSVVNGILLPDYLQVNMAAALHLPGLGDQPLNLRVDLINTSDSRYQCRDGTKLGGGTAQFARGRGIFVGVEQGF